MSKYEQSINTAIRNHLLGKASDAEEQQLQEWLARSPENKVNYENLLQASNLADRYKKYSAIDVKRAKIEFKSKHQFSHRFAWRQTLRYAAVLILAIAGASIWMLKNSHTIIKPVIPHEAMVAMLRSQNMGKQQATLTLTNGQRVNLNTLSAAEKVIQNQEQQNTSTKQKESSNLLKTQNNTEYWVTLDDGSRVHLNYSTTLKYPSHFSDEDRTVYLDGEAYFYVAKDSKRPFYVVTPNGRVREYGTSFNVNTHDEIGKTKVVLVEGSISIITSQGNEYMMRPGELAVAQASSQQVQINKVNVDTYIAWNSGRFVFDNCPLEKLMAKLSLWYGKDISFDSNEIRHLCYTGDIDRYSSLPTVLKALEKVTGFSIENTQNKIIVRGNSNND